MSIVEAMSALGAISLILAVLAYLDGRKTAELVNKTAELTKEQKEYIDLMKSKHVDLHYTSSTFEGESSFTTQFHFFNKGNMPATDVKIRLIYPAGTKIQRITPPIKYTESENGKEKVVEIHVQRMAIDMPLGFLVLSEFEPIEPPKILYHEQKAVQTVMHTQLKG